MGRYTCRYAWETEGCISVGRDPRHDGLADARCVCVCVTYVCVCVCVCVCCVCVLCEHVLYVCVCLGVGATPAMGAMTPGVYTPGATPAGMLGQLTPEGSQIQVRVCVCVRVNLRERVSVCSVRCVCVCECECDRVSVCVIDPHDP